MVRPLLLDHYQEKKDEYDLIAYLEALNQYIDYLEKLLGFNKYYLGDTDQQKGD